MIDFSDGAVCLINLEPLHRHHQFPPLVCPAKILGRYSSHCVPIAVAVASLCQENWQQITALHFLATTMWLAYKEKPTNRIEIVKARVDTHHTVTASCFLRTGEFEPLLEVSHVRIVSVCYLQTQASMHQKVAPHTHGTL